ncbi:hypothetical protein N7505_007692 [Penicillium chrysogenum]|uniref:Cyclin N-terminal domain-containing protein n=1 Tax=Penicillium chrysogenum TaxID=5076 RepID=A0ABQ8WF26_PENCH|nr:hypothetical protein N7505_007692 [Penicillium chrysogenum]
MVVYLAQQAAQVISYEAHVTNIVQVSILMSSLVYLGRLRARLPRVVIGMRCSAHRIFLASLIIAAKSLDDSSPKNKHWAQYTMVKNYEGFGFSLPEVNSMEHELLVLLDWETHVTEEDIFTYLSPFLLPIRERIQDQERQRKIEDKRLEQEPNGSSGIANENEGIVFKSQ